MKELIPIPQDSFTRLKQEKSMEIFNQLLHRGADSIF